MRKAIKSFFVNKENILHFIIYFWATVFLTEIALAFAFRLWSKMDAKLDLSDGLLLGMMGFVIALLTVYTWFITHERRNPGEWDRLEKRGKQIISDIGNVADESEGLPKAIKDALE